MKVSKFIPASILLALVAATSCLRAQELRLSQGASMVASGDVKLVLTDMSFASNGSFVSGSSTVIFNSQGITKYLLVIDGSAPINFNNLTLALPYRSLLLQQDIAVYGALNMQGGNIELTRYNIHLGITGSIVGENIQSYITGVKGGTVTAIADLRSPQNVNPGNIGIFLTSTGNFGTTLITRGHVQQVNNRGQQSIQRYFDVNSSFNAGKMSVQLQYLEPELAGLKAPELFTWSGRTDGAWTTVTKNASGPYDLSVQNRFTLGAGSNGLSLIKYGNIKASVQAYPNPTTGRFTLTISASEAEAGTLTLHDGAGRLVEKRRLNTGAGLNTFQFDLSGYGAGTYLLMLENGSGKEYIKIVKQ